METSDHLTDLRKKAEAAVADMPDGELKTKAFEVILQHLLAAATRNTMIVVQPTERRSKDKKKGDSSRAPGTAKSRILLLKDEGFFTGPRALAEVEHELKAHGWVHPQTGLSGPLQGLVQERHLRRLKEKIGNKKVWKYVNP